MFLSLFFIIPVAIFSVLLYFSFLIFPLGIFPVLLSAFTAVWISRSFLRRYHPVKFSPLILLPAVILFLAAAVVLSPLVLPVHFNGFTFLTYPSATDYFKHLYTITSVSHYGIPSQHPYFPPGQFSYYIGYYLIPSAFTYIFPRLQNWILYLYVLFTGGISLLFLCELYSRFVRGKLISILVFLPVCFGMGWDIIPTLIDHRSPGGRLIELWSISHNLQLRVDNPYTAYLWTPQHFFSAVVALTIVYLFLFTTNRRVHLYLGLYLYLFLSSVFIFIPVIIFTALYLLFYSRDIKFVFRTGLLTFILSLPYLSSLAGRSSLFTFFTPGVFPFFASGILNRFTTAFIEYGPLMFLMPLWLPAFIRKIKLRQFYFAYLSLLVPVLLTWFLRSPNYNDFALRSILPLQLIIPLLAGWVIENSRKTIKYILLLIICVTVIGSLPGFVYEYSVRWKERGMLDVSTSEMLMAVRRLPPSVTLAAIGRSEWIFQIPPLGFRPVLTSNLYDSANYLGPVPGDLHTKYEILEQEIFSTQTIDRDLSSTLIQRNSKLSDLSVFFSAFTYDSLIIPANDPWASILISLGVRPAALTPQFLLLPRKQLVNHSLRIASVGSPLTINNHRVLMSAGSWFLVSCNTADISYQSLVIQDRVVYQGSVPQNGCIGNIYFQPDSREVSLSSASAVSNLTAFPLVVN